ncbi:MAG: GNAT family N-acetyltransferase [Verrucomicrobiota bacterium]
MNEGISIHQADPRDDSAATLLRALAEEEAVRYADLGPDIFDSFRTDDVLAGRGAFVIARLDGDSVGCGALRQMNPSSAEVNRMYVVPTARRQGVAGAILRKLERQAAEFGYRSIRAETGNRQPEAVSFYKDAGFYRVPPFGSHANDPISIFFEKTLST